MTEKKTSLLMLLMHILAKLRSSAFVNKHSRWKLFAFNGQKSGPTKPILKESEQIALIIKAHGRKCSDDAHFSF